MLSKTKMVNIGKGIEKMFIGVCTVFETQKYLKDDKTTGFIEREVFRDVPCRISFNTSKSVSESTEENKGVALASQKAKLFLDKGIDIKIGSKIFVTQNGQTFIYRKSGQAKFYETHQEISVVLEEFA